MTEILFPGVFLEEIDAGIIPIEGVSTSTAAFFGETGRGPTRPVLVTSFTDYRRWFGGDFGTDKFMPYALAGFFENGGRRAWVCRIAGAGAATASRTIGGLRIEAVGAGAWGNRVFVKLTDSTTRSGPDSTPVGFRLQIACWAQSTPDNRYPDPFEPDHAPTKPLPIIEEFDDLVWDDPASPDYFVERIGRAAAIVTVATAEPDGLAAQPIAGFAPLAGGTDGAAPTVADYNGENLDPDLRTGLAALELGAYDEVALIAAPGAPDAVVAAIVAHCESNKFRFAVLDVARGQANAAALDPRAKGESAYAAFYYPWIYVAEPESGARRLVPPSGHVLGLYARSDIERGVWKAPANDILRGTLDLEYRIDDATQALLNPRGVNAIRQFPALGIRVWGARTLSANSLWKYVNVRRLFIFLERSIDEGTQWVVFEPNDERLWGRVRDTIRQFLRAQWRAGALTGVTEKEAFFIACGPATMTQDDIANGRLICEIGIAPLRPAEFVIFRIFQNTACAGSVRGMVAPHPRR